MRAATLRRLHSEPGVRFGTIADLDALVALERLVFAADAMSPRSLKRFLGSPSTAVLVAEYSGGPVGCGITLYRPNSSLARLYSLAVVPQHEGSGVGPLLIGACENAARARGCSEIRLEVHEENQRAIACYRKVGYREFGRHVGYYKDLGDALRFRKFLTSPS